jgi:hypothetical protein
MMGTIATMGRRRSGPAGDQPMMPRYGPSAVGVLVLVGLRVAGVSCHGKTAERWPRMLYVSIVKRFS